MSKWRSSGKETIQREIKNIMYWQGELSKRIKIKLQDHPKNGGFHKDSRLRIGLQILS